MTVNSYLLYFLLWSSNWYFSNSFKYFLGNKLRNNENYSKKFTLKLDSHRKNYHFSQKYTEELLKRIQMNKGIGNNTKTNSNIAYYETLLQKLNSKNESIQNISILGEDFDSFYRNLNLN